MSGLRPFDLRLLQLLADGRDYRAIADELGRSYQGVKNMGLDILQKLGAENKTHAVAIALRKGLIQ